MSTIFELKLLDKRVKPLALGSAGAAGFDLQAARLFDHLGHPIPMQEEIRLLPGEQIDIGAGCAIHITDTDKAAMILPRSGKGRDGLVVGNLVGLIDSDYQGELKICLWNRHPTKTQVIKPLERIAQLVIVPVLQVGFNVVDEFSQTSERGAGGFGSTGS